MAKLFNRNVFEAFKEMGANDATAMKAAEALNEPRLQKIERDLLTLKLMVGGLYLGMADVFRGLWLILERLP